MDGILGEEELLSVFRREGLLPRRLTEIKELDCGHFPTRAAFVAAFAACVYPQRAYQMKRPEANGGNEYLMEDELLQRVRCFTEFTSTLPDECGDAHTWANRWSMNTSNVARILADIAGVEKSRTHEERELRLAGAALHLGTCTPASLERILANWQSHEDGRLLGFLRTSMRRAPSCVSGESRRETIDWDFLRKRLPEIFGREHADLCDCAINLEHAARNCALRCGLRGQALEERVGEFWEAMVEDHLDSGFPYFSFRSRLVYWWKQCAICFAWWRREVPLEREDRDDDSDEAAVDPSPLPTGELSLEGLGFFREGYRLVRSSFFARGEVGRTPAGAAAANEKVRGVVDALWSERLLQLMDGGETAPRRVDEIATAHRVGVDEINNWNHRLGQRLFAYLHARRYRSSNAECRAAKAPRRGERAATVCPLEAASGWEPVAATGRVVSARRTLLWIFTARLLLQGKVDPQHPDPWSFERYLLELWRWLTDDDFHQAFAAAAKRNHRAERMAQRVSHEPVWRPLAEVVEQMRRLCSVHEAENWLAGRDFTAARRAALDLLASIAGPDGLAAAEDGAVREWRRLVPSAGHIWIVPVWHLVFIERHDLPETMRRLRVDPEEEPSVAKLTEGMAASRTAP